MTVTSEAYPITVVATKPITRSLPAPSYGNGTFAYVVVKNITPYAIQVVGAFDTKSNTPSLAPGMADLYGFSGTNGNLSVRFLTTTSKLKAGIIPYILVDYYENKTEVMGSSYPAVASPQTPTTGEVTALVTGTVNVKNKPTVNVTTGKIKVRNTGTTPAIIIAGRADRLNPTFVHGANTYSFTVSATKVKHSYDCLAIIVSRPTTRKKIQCVSVIITVTPVHFIQYSYSACFQTVPGTTAQVVAYVPITNLIGHKIFGHVYTTGTLLVTTITVIGLTKAPIPSIRSDGRGYPISRYTANGGGNTGTLIAAPSGAKRILLAQLNGNFFTATATAASLNVFGVIAGVTTRLVRVTSISNQRVFWTLPIPAQGLLLDPNQALKFTSVHQSGNTLTAIYDIVI